jgi:hypothetical protein
MTQIPEEVIYCEILNYFPVETRRLLYNTHAKKYCKKDDDVRIRIREYCDSMRFGYSYSTIRYVNAQRQKSVILGGDPWKREPYFHLPNPTYTCLSLTQRGARCKRKTKVNNSLVSPFCCSYHQGDKSNIPLIYPATFK